MCYLQLTNLVLLGTISNLDSVSLQQIIKCIRLFKYRYLDSFLWNSVPTFPNATFAVLNTEPSNMQGAQWIMIAKYPHNLYFAESCGREKYRFLKQHYKRMIPKTQHCLPSICNFFTIYAAFHLFKFRQEGITGVHSVDVVSFSSSYWNFFHLLMYNSNLFSVFVNNCTL